MLRTLVHDYFYIHLGIGLVGNLLFVIGSILFFKAFENWYTTAVWMFVLGSGGYAPRLAGAARQDHLRSRRTATELSRAATRAALPRLPGRGGYRIPRE